VLGRKEGVWARRRWVNLITRYVNVMRKRVAYRAALRWMLPCWRELVICVWVLLK
jgi:hypothetical protein